MADTKSPMELALEREEEIGQEAAAIREEFTNPTKIDESMLMRLWPLLRRPIPEAFINTVGTTKGKPYESRGVRSVQVQMDRMDRVLTPLGWWIESDYSDDGTLCHVRVCVGTGPESLYERDSWGGVDRGSSRGNVRKGSFTNAAKLAIARVGPGWEIYVGIADLDPDVSEELASAESEPTKTIGREMASEIANRALELVKPERLRLAASHVAERDVGECGSRPKAASALESLSFAQAERLDRWLSSQADEKSSDTPSQSASEGS